MGEIPNFDPEDLDRKFDDVKKASVGKEEVVDSGGAQVLEKDLNIVSEEDKRDTTLEIGENVVSGSYQQTSHEQEDLPSEIKFLPEKVQKVYSEEEKEKLTREELKQAISDDMKEFLDSGKGRPCTFWTRDIYKHSKIEGAGWVAMRTVADEILNAEVKDFSLLVRMISYFYKLNSYDGDDALLHNHEIDDYFADDEKEDKKFYKQNKETFQQMRKKVIKMMLTNSVNLDSKSEVNGFIGIYELITPQVISNISLIKGIWHRLRYGLETIYGETVQLRKMKPKDAISYIRNQLRKMCKLQGIKLES